MQVAEKDNFEVLEVPKSAYVITSALKRKDTPLSSRIVKAQKGKMLSL